jgi:hypothetical protein
LREQSDSVEEQLTNEKEVKRLRRDIHVGKMQWRQDRQRLIEIIMNLQLSVQVCAVFLSSKSFIFSVYGLNQQIH